MMQPAEFWQGDYLSVRRGALCRIPTSRSLLAQTEMSAVVVAVADILGHEAFQMTLVQLNDVFEQIAQAVADESLCYPILPRASNCISNRVHAQILRGLQSLRLESVLAVEDEIPRRGIIREGLPKLLS